MGNETGSRSYHIRDLEPILNFLPILTLVVLIKRIFIKKRRCIALTEVVARNRSVKRIFLKLLQNSQESICVGVSILTKLKAGGQNFA